MGNTPCHAAPGLAPPTLPPTPPRRPPSRPAPAPPPLTATSHRHRQVVIHFYRPSTLRCQIVDRHLGELAQGHLETRFLKINAEKCPFLVEKLRIIMLPTILCVKVCAPSAFQELLTLL